MVLTTLRQYNAFFVMNYYIISKICQNWVK